ncbi:hypothetical protein N5079_03800 [Planotetraspora sp. A-T 1434]|uniref:hypothetical protein n=1 Tax=Planotetraspora sp. A-T 1434 TaxID=2979219 RepID=UPI0021C17038|nr:hypothetical protein [Planotetraspora sp. A-T 1434]MCT9929339.1 hypothetical protein [Planotetraspora sp. A-T 1434]
MDAESTICLSDLVPALRWSRPQQVAEMLADPRLPGGWWASVALGRALDTTGIDWLCERLARLAVGRWDHLPLTDLLPALQVHTVDPALPGWPESARAVVNGIGGWYRLRRLTPYDLQSPTAAASPEVILSTLFREIFGHLQRQPHRAEQPTAASVTAPPAPDSQRPDMQGPDAQRPDMQGPDAQRPDMQGPDAQRPEQPVPGPLVPGPRAEQPEPPMPGRPEATRSEPVQPPIPQQPLPQRQSPQQPLPQQPVAQQPLSQQPVAQASEPPPVAQPAPNQHPMVGVVDGLFRGWDPLAKAVAAQRLFAAEPVSLRTLAHDLNVDRDMLSHAQRAAEERVLHWLRSPDSAPLTGHMFGLTEWLGAAATQEQLIAADPSHPIEVPTLGTPLWRVLVTLMPDRRLQDGWLVVGDLAGLREKTRQLLANKPADADVVELLGQLGIRAHSAKAWLDSMPPATPSGAQRPDQAAAEGTKPLPRRTPGANGHHHQRGGVPIPSQANNGPDAATALAALNALTGGAPRPHLVPNPRTTPSPTSDPRRWQRIDVTSGHLRGEPVAVPEGYAAQLGMRPGTLLSVTGPGDNAVVLIWRDRQPMFDSLQPVLMRLNARPGDSVYVTVDGYRLDAQLTS